MEELRVGMNFFHWSDHNDIEIQLAFHVVLLSEWLFTHLVKQGNSFCDSNGVNNWQPPMWGGDRLPTADPSVRLSQHLNYDTPFHKLVPLQIQNKEYK